MKRILAIPLGIHSDEDRMSWHFPKNGEYSVKSGYQLVISFYSETGSSSSSDISSFWRKLSGIRLPWKIIILLRRAYTNCDAPNSVKRFTPLKPNYSGMPCARASFNYKIHNFQKLFLNKNMSRYGNLIYKISAYEVRN